MRSISPIIVATVDDYVRCLFLSCLLVLLVLFHWFQYQRGRHNHSWGIIWDAGDKKSRGWKASKCIRVIKGLGLGGGGGVPSSNSSSSSDSGEIGGGFDNADVVAKRMALRCRYSAATKTIEADGVGED